MASNPPPIQEMTTNAQNGRFPQVWIQWFDSVFRALSGQETMPLLSSTVAEVPDATQAEGHIIYVSDETGGAVLAFSDGVNWRRVTDRNVIS